MTVDRSSDARAGGRDPTLQAPGLPLGVYRFVFERAQAAGRRGFDGSAWRGAFGHALRRTVCVTRLPACEGCLLYRSCVSPYIFETPPPPDAERLRRYPAAPHPFVLVRPLADDPQRTDVEVGVTLVGHAVRQLPYVVHAMQRAGAAGIGRARVQHELAKVEQQVEGSNEKGWCEVYRPGGLLETQASFEPQPPPMAGDVRVRLLTPLRARRDGHLVGADAFTPGDLVVPLLRRVSLLSYFHTDRPLEADFKALVTGARAMRASHTDLRWHDWMRYSSRQRTGMRMGGLVGSFVLRAADAAPFWPLLWLGQWTHAGKAASMGLGRYRLEPATLPESAPADG